MLPIKTPAILLAAAILATGCKDDTHGHTSNQTRNTGGSHAGHSHDGDDHAGHDERPLGSITLGDAVLNVSISGNIQPNATLHIEIQHIEGPTPAAIRVWVGDESATGSIKDRATGNSGRYHGHAQIPSTLTAESALWIEVETPDGERSASSLPLE